MLDCVYTHKYLSKCATYYALKLCGLRILQQFPEAFIYCLVPDEQHQANIFINDDLVQNPRWTNIPLFYSRDRNTEMFYPSDELKDTIVNWSHVCWDWDMLLTTRNNGTFFESITGKRRFFPMKQLILIEPFPMFSFKKTYVPRKWSDLRFLTSYMHFDKIYIQTEWEMRETIEIAKRYLAPFYVGELIKKISVAYPTELTYQEPTKRTDPTLQVIYTQRLDEAERKVSKVMETVWYSFVQNSYNVRFHISTNGLSEVPMDDKKFIIFGRLPREEFWEKLKKMDVFLTWSIEEGMPYSLLEASYFGVIGVARRANWSEDFFGKDYFGLVDNIEEAIGLIRWIYEHRDEAWDKFKVWHMSYFKNYLVKRGNQFEQLNGYIENYWKESESKIKADKPREDEDNLSLAADLNKECKHRLDFTTWREWDGESRERNAPFYRRRDFWIDRLRLLFLYNWQDTKDCGVLERKYR